MARFARPRPADILDGMVHYLVDTPDGSVGIVDEWERDEHGRPRALVVAQGWFGRHRFEVPLGALLEIDHAERRIVLTRGAAPLELEGPLRRLLELGEGRSDEEAAAASPRRPDKARPVLCGVADDRRAPAVAAVAAHLARKLAAPLILAHITPAHVPPGVSAAAAGQARLRDEEKRQADDLIDALLSHPVSNTDVERVVLRGIPAETLEELARKEGAQLLVIGATGKGSLGTVLKGSVSQQVISHAGCPVVVVPPELTRADDEEDDDSSGIAELAGVALGRRSR